MMRETCKFLASSPFRLHFMKFDVGRLLDCLTSLVMFGVLSLQLPVRKNTVMVKT